MKWNSEAELLLVKWGETSQGMSIMYQQAFNKVSRRERWFGTPVTLLGAIMTSSSYLQLDQCNIKIGYVNCSLAMLMTIITAIRNKYLANKGEYSNAAEAYNKIARDIQEQLVRPPEDRVECASFISQMKEAMSNLTSAPVLPRSIYNKYMRDIDKHLQQMGVNVLNCEMKSLIRGTPQVSPQVSIPNDKFMSSKIIHQTPNPIQVQSTVQYEPEVKEIQLRLDKHEHHSHSEAVTLLHDKDTILLTPEIVLDEGVIKLNIESRGSQLSEHCGSIEVELHERRKKRFLTRHHLKGSGKNNNNNNNDLRINSISSNSGIKNSNSSKNSHSNSSSKLSSKGITIDEVYSGIGERKAQMLEHQRTIK